MINRKELRKQFPKGYCQKIAEKAGVNITSVSRYFSGKMNSEKIENEALKMAAEINHGKRLLEKAVYE